jgi:hypothetical protein
MNRLPEARSWEDTRELIEKFYWMDNLADEWEVCWRAAMFRVKRARRGPSQVDEVNIKAYVERLLVQESSMSTEPDEM